MKKVFDEKAEFTGQTLLAYVAAQPSTIKKRLLAILKELNIDAEDPEAWYKLDSAIQFYQRVREEFGPNTVYNLGKMFGDLYELPPEIDTLEKFLHSLDTMYQATHRNGYAGSYEVVSHDPENREYVLRSHTPYPYELIKGLLSSVGRDLGDVVRVKDVPNKPSQAKGDEESWFSVTYF
jgi:hypothetical protein